MINTFTGTGTALVTPFDNKGNIDFSALSKFVNFQIDNGIDFLVVQGTTGESPTLSWKEKLEVLECVKDANKKRLPIVFGLGGNNTLDVQNKLAQLPEGVDGILSVSPYYNKPTQSGIVAHFKAVASATDLPIIMYNVPGRTASNMSVETTLELAEVSNIVAVKEASGNMEQIMKIIRQKPKGFGVLSGDDALITPLRSMGADGVISVVSNAFPKEFSDMVKMGGTDKHKLAVEIHNDLADITDMFFAEGNPGGVKVTLKHRDLMGDFMRLPLFPVSEMLQGKIIKESNRILNK
jgi:4-hydroxy-tetrahydrodipicolinate synthase